MRSETVISAWLSRITRCSPQGCSQVSSKATGWAAGYGDYVMKPDLSTLRRLPWAPGTAFCMVDLYDHHTHELIPHAPRSVLRRQIARAEAIIAGIRKYFAKNPPLAKSRLAKMF